MRIIVLNDFHFVQFSMRNLHIRIGQVLKYRILTFFGWYFSLSNKVTTRYITVHTLLNRVLSVIKKDARLLLLFLFFSFCFLSLGAGDTFHFLVSLFSCGLSFSLGSTDPDCRQYKTCTECILGSPECSWCEDRVSSIVLFHGKSL